jgi:hypothetical protein
MLDTLAESIPDRLLGFDKPVVGQSEFLCARNLRTIKNPTRIAAETTIKYQKAGVFSSNVAITLNKNTTAYTTTEEVSEFLVFMLKP